MPRGRRDRARDRRGSCASTRPTTRRSSSPTARGKVVDLPPPAGRRQPRAACASWPRIARRPRSPSTSPSTGATRSCCGPATPAPARCCSPARCRHETIEAMSSALGGTLRPHGRAQLLRAIPPSRPVAASAAPAASGGSAARGLVLEALRRRGDLLAAAADGSSRGAASRSCSAARCRVTEPACLNQRTRTSPKPASASSRVRTSRVPGSGEIDGREVGQVRAQVMPREVLGRERPDEQAAPGREHAPRLGQRARPAVAERVHDQAHRDRIEPALAERQVVGLRELEGGPAHAPLARLGEHLPARRRRPTP